MHRKLSPQQVIEIFMSVERTKVLAALYDVSEFTIRAIKRKRTHGDTVGQLQLLPVKSNRHILSDQTVCEIYEFSGTLSELKAKFNVSKQVAHNIKFRHTYTSVTADLGVPGELRVHSLTWDDVCTIRASNRSSDILAELFGVSRGTINNIRAGRTRQFK